MTPKKANIYDVATMAGVSHQTVSRVLNSHQSVKPETKEKVEKAIRKLNYHPNQAARMLVTSKSRMIGLLVAGSELYGPAATLKAMESRARDEGYSVISFSVIPESRESWREGIEQLRILNIDGVITISLPKGIIEEVQKILAGTALVVARTEPSKKFDSVNVNNEEGARIATEHLLELGHENILHITGPAHSYESQTRRLGYEKAMKKAGLTPTVIEGDWSIEAGFGIAKELVESQKIPTAIFCANDHLALGVIKALNQDGINVPADVSIVGFDDIPEAAYFLPSLTTINQDFNELGSTAVNRALLQIRETPESVDLFIEPTLVVRNSTAPLTPKKRK